MSIHDAILLAVQAHRSQKDKCGKDYIYHPLRVMLAVDTDEARMVAVLHDVVEDTTYSLDDLAELGYSDVVLAGVDAVTRRLGEPYEAFVFRAKADPIGRIVKIADVQDNLSWLDFLSSEKEQASLVKRYEKALRILQSEG